MDEQSLPIIVYLDWNIISYLQAGEIPEFEKVLFDAKKDGRIQIPFSAEHVSEACNIRQTSEKDANLKKKNRLDYLSKLCSDLYFYNNQDSTGFRKESPISVFKTLNDTKNELNYEIDIKDLLVNMIPFELLKKSRKMLNLDSSILNNISPEDAVNKIDEIINSKENIEKYLKESDQNMSFKGMLEYIIKIMDEVSGDFQYYQQIKQKKYYSLENMIVFTFSYLDSFGFWADKKSTYERGSLYADSSHAFNGRFTNYIISEDKRFCMKTRATYHLLGIKTKVFHFKEDKNEIEHLLKPK